MSRCSSDIPPMTTSDSTVIKPLPNYLLRVCPLCEGEGLNPSNKDKVCPKCNGERKVGPPRIEPPIYPKPVPPVNPPWQPVPYPYPDRIWCNNSGGWQV